MNKFLKMGAKITNIFFTSKQGGQDNDKLLKHILS